jgi:undecaprenyl-diphosphatase
MTSFDGVDLGLLYFFGSLHRPWLDPIVQFWTRLGDVVVLTPLTTIVVLLFLRLGLRREAAVLALVGLSCVAIERSGKWLVERPRPDVVWRLIDLPSSSSFPSGHALASLAIYATIGLIVSRQIAQRKRLAQITFLGFGLLGLSVGLTRIYVGVHYPFDVLGGWLAGGAVFLFGLHWLEPRATPE